MGFDKSYFINDFSNLYGIGDSTRPSDASVYENLLRWYRADIQQEDVPQFVYCLTYQNHGGFGQRDAEYDTIHTVGDYDFADEFDEYLTGIDYSIQAFYSLIRELDKSDRPVIVCMMGDHCPYLINYNQISLEDRDLVVRSVPVLWWSNAGYTFDDIDTVSINYVSSILLSKSVSPIFPPCSDTSNRLYPAFRSSPPTAIIITPGATSSRTGATTLMRLPSAITFSWSITISPEKAD